MPRWVGRDVEKVRTKTVRSTRMGPTWEVWLWVREMPHGEWMVLVDEYDAEAYLVLSGTCHETREDAIQEAEEYIEKIQDPLSALAELSHE